MDRECGSIGVCVCGGVVVAREWWVGKRGETILHFQLHLNILNLGTYTSSCDRIRFQHIRFNVAPTHPIYNVSTVGFVQLSNVNQRSKVRGANLWNVCASDVCFMSRERERPRGLPTTRSDGRSSPFLDLILDLRYRGAASKKALFACTSVR